jgi:hypothetical protein
VAKGKRKVPSRTPTCRTPRRGWLKRAAARWSLASGFLSRLGKRERLAIAVAVLSAAAIAYLLIDRIPGEQPAEFELQAHQGTSAIELKAEPESISPGCGCKDPTFGKHPWAGMSIPSTGFELDVAAPRSDDTASGLWSLTAMEPELGPIDWYGVPPHSLRMTVLASNGYGAKRVLFRGPATHFVLWTDKPVSVEQPLSNPYAALLPAAGGTTTFISEEAARSEWGGHVDISSSAPERGEAEVRHRERSPEETQRGPMIDLLGPTVRFTLSYTSRTRLWAAMKEVKPAQPGETLTIYLRTPFSLRLFSHPVQLDWQVDLPGSWRRNLEGWKAGEIPRWEMAQGQTGQGRFILNEPLPSYAVQLRHLSTPSRAAWRSFAGRSARRALIKPMLGEARMDRGHLITAEFALPPVSPRPQIGVFGQITDFNSSSVDGRAVIGPTAQSIPSGEELHFHSDGGVGAGIYHLSPLISSGQPTDRTAVAGDATVWIGGSVASHPDWFPWIPFGGLIGALLGVAVTAAFRWVHHGTGPPDEATNTA